MADIKKRLPLHCPACDERLKVRRLSCEQCNTEVCGDFELSILSRLSDKEQLFVINFIKSSGSLKDMANSMKISYPTVRNVLDELIDKLNNDL